MVDPDSEAENPHLVRALHQALEHGIVTLQYTADRAAVNGDQYRVSDVFTITTTQSSAYFYVENNTDNMFVLDEDQIKVTGANARIYVRDEPTVDTSTFTQIEFINGRSDITPGPDQNAYFGYDTDVTINDLGRIYDVDYIKASSGSPGDTMTGTGSNGGISYIIGPQSSAILEVENDGSSEIEVSIGADFHEIRELPNVII
jgi:hypothetical protein